MAKHDISTYDRDKADEKINEYNMINEILKIKFFEILEENGYDYDKLKQMFDTKNINSIEQNNFNKIIRMIKELHDVSIKDSIIFLEENFTTFQKIISIFDEQTNFELKQEVSNKFFIKIDKTNLDEIMD